MSNWMSDARIFVVCYVAVLRSCLRQWGRIKGWHLAYLWALYGVQEQQQTRHFERTGETP